MSTTTHIRLEITIHLEGNDQYDADTPTGRIRVRQVRLSVAGKPYIAIDGRAIKKDGTLAYFNRSDRVSFQDLTDVTKAAIRVALVQRFGDAGVEEYDRLA